MTSLTTVTQEIMQQMPPSMRFSLEDGETIIKHQVLLLGLGEDLIQSFYDTLYAHPPTAAIFIEGERPAREETLRQWWQRTVTGPFDTGYWVWQTFVGLIHVKRRVKNVMMMSMWGWLLSDFLREQLTGKMSDAEAEHLLVAFERLGTTVQALTAESYLTHYIQAVLKSTGFNYTLLQTMVATEVDDLVQEHKLK